MAQMMMSPETMYDQTRQMSFGAAMGVQPAQIGVPPDQLPTTLTAEQIQQLGQQGVAQQALREGIDYPSATMSGMAQAQAQAQPGYVPPPPSISPITGMAPGKATFDTALGQYTEASARQDVGMDAYTQAIGDQSAALTREGQAQQEGLQVAADKGLAMAGVDAERETEAAGYVDKRAQLMAQFDKANAVQERKMQMAVDAAANTSIHNFWADKSTGAKILGVIAQALSGAANGLAGNPSAPTPLDRLINTDLEMQTANQQNTRQVAQQQQTTYQQMLLATGNRLDAETALHLAARDRVTTMVQTLADKFATPEAAAKAKEFAAQNDQKKAELKQRRTEMQMRIAAQDAQGSLGVMADAERLGVVAGAATANAAAKAAKGGKGDDYYEPLPGMLEGVPKAHQTPSNYNRVAKESEAITSYLHMMAEARRALETGGWDAYYGYVAKHNVGVNLMRNATGAGANLTGQEAPINNSFNPSWLRTHMLGNIIGAKQMLDANEEAWGSVLLNKYKSLNPNGAIDYNAEDIGPVLKRVISKRQQGKTGASNGQVGQH